MLCNRCESRFYHFNTNFERDSSSTITIAELETSRLAGCYICPVLLVDNLAEDHEPWPTDRNETLHDLWAFFTPMYELCITIERKQPLQRRIVDKRIDLRPILPKPGMTPATILNLELPEKTSDPKTYNTTQKWLSNCLAHHHDCEKAGHPTYMPPRLLWLDNDITRLVSTNDNPPCVQQYATLSHCWGPKPTFMTLTAQNLNAFQESLPYKRLPKTFQGAIILCKNIGIFYVWIDSLCIIQSGDGSIEDWQHHVAAMPEIYRNGYLNIAAEWAESSEEGLFRTRSPLLLQSHVVTLKEEDHPEESYVLYAEVPYSGPAKLRSDSYAGL